MIDGQRCVPNTEMTLSDEGHAHQPTKLLPAGSTCVVCIGTIGKLCQLHQPSFTNQQLNSVAVDETRFDPDFVYYLMCATIPAVKQLHGGSASGREHVRKSLFESIHVRVPPLRAQRRIAGILSAYDDLIENNAKRMKLLEEMARALYREWFVHFRFPGYENLKLVDSPLGQIPERWEVSTVGDETTKVGSGATPKGGKGAYKESGLTLIRSLNVYDYRFTDKGLAFIDEAQAGKLENVIVEPRDVLLNITGASVARCCMVRERHLPARVNQHVAIVRANTARIDPYYLLCTMNNGEQKRQLLAFAQGGATREALTKGTIKGFPLVVPPRAVVAEFGEIAGSYLRLRAVLEHSNAVLRETRDLLLLPRLISGEIDVDNLDLPEAAQ